MPAPTASIPAAYIAIRASGEKAWFGWPDVPEVEKEVAAWFEAKTLDEEKAVIARAQQGGAWSNVVYVADRLLPTATRPGAGTSAAS